MCKIHDLASSVNTMPSVAGGNASHGNKTVYMVNFEKREGSKDDNAVMTTFSNNMIPKCMNEIRDIVECKVALSVMRQMKQIACTKLHTIGVNMMMRQTRKM